MVLHINTKDQKKITVFLKTGRKIISKISEESKYGSQVLLSLIIKLLHRIHTPGVDIQTPGVDIQNHSWSGYWKDLEGIEVETGPGSFTGLRVGVAVANALGFALGVRVNGKKTETELKY